MFYSKADTLVCCEKKGWNSGLEKQNYMSIMVKLSLSVWDSYFSNDLFIGYTWSLNYINIGIHQLFYGYTLTIFLFAFTNTSTSNLDNGKVSMTKAY